MLWRVLLTAVAFTCTFAGEIVHTCDNATQRALKDLLCVLVLSGMQREDLDVTLLQKLQKHDVNINIIDSDQLRTECMVRKFSKPEETNIYSSTAGADSKANSDRSVRDVANLNGFKETFMDLHNGENNRISLLPQRKNNDQYLETTISDVTKNTTMVNISVTEIAMTKNKNATEAPVTNGASVTKTDAKENQTKLDNVIKFWEVYVKNVSNISPHVTEADKAIKETIRTTVTVTTRSQMNEKNANLSKKEPEKFNSSEIERISRLIAKLINKHTTESPLLPEHVMDTVVSKQINEILKINTDEKNVPNKHDSEKDDTLVAPYKDKPWSEETLPTFAEFQSHADNPSYSKTRDERQKPDNRFDKYVRMKTNLHSITPLALKSPFNFDTKNVMADEDTSMNFLKTNTTETDNLDKLYSDNVRPAAFSADLIKQLADNIKEMVLKDIRKEITITTAARYNIVETSTVKIAATKTANISAAGNIKPRNDDHDKIQQATNAIEKFLKLIEKLERKNEKNVNIMRYLASESNDHTYGMVTPVLPYAYYAPASHPMMDSTLHPLKPITKVQPPMIPSRNPFLFQAPLMPKQNINRDLKKTKAIMIQTNSKEIPPLGIRLARPLMPNQNLIVTTRAPWTTSVMYSQQQRLEYVATNDRNLRLQDENNKRKAQLSEYTNIPKQVPDIILASSAKGPYIDKYKSSVAVESVAIKPSNRYQGTDERYKFVPKASKKNYVNYKDIRKIIAEYDASKDLAVSPMNNHKLKAIYDDISGYGQSIPYDNAFYPYKDALRTGIEHSYRVDKYTYDDIPRMGSRWSAGRGKYDVPKAITEYNVNFKNELKSRNGIFNDNIESVFKPSNRHNSDNFKNEFYPNSNQYDDNFKSVYKSNSGFDTLNNYASSHYETRKDIFNNLNGYYIQDEDLNSKYDVISKPSSKFYNADNSNKYNDHNRELSIQRLKPLEYSDRLYRELNDRNDFRDRHQDVVDIEEGKPRSHIEAYNFNTQFEPTVRTSDIKGFHEQLERVNDYTQQDRESWETGRKEKIDIASTREQRPLSSMKLGSKFDDTHFQDFLKTQQKVNDMLEKILSRRPNHAPRSVEAA